MNPQHGIIHTLVVPFLIGMIVVSAYVVYKHNPEILNPAALLTTIQKEKANGEIFLSSELESSANGLVSAKKPERLGHRWQATVQENFKNTILPGPVLWWRMYQDLILAKGSNWFGSIAKDGSIQWIFHLPKGEEWTEGELAINGNQVVDSSASGSVYSIDVRSGGLHWFWSNNYSLFSSPRFYKDQLILFEKISDQTWSLLRFDSSNPSQSTRLADLKWPLATPAQISEDGILYYATKDGSIHAIDLKTMQIQWNGEISSGYRGAITLSADRIYISNEDGLLNILERKSGKKLSEIELETPLVSRIHFVEGTNYGIAMNQNNYLVAFDTKLAKRIWRYNLKQNDSFSFAQLHRMSSDSLEKLSFLSEVRGWSVWTICQGRQVCAFDVKNGVPLLRFDLKAAPTAEFQIDGDPIRLVVPLSLGGQQYAFSAFEPPAPKTANPPAAEKSP